jgi:SAM-dependent methyltransferase
VARRPPRTPPAVRGFDRAADRYERARPQYPSAAVRILGRALHVGPRRTVVELGSGTGKFTRAIAPWGAARVAVEPTPGMRDVFRRTVPDVPVLDGTAEAIPLPDSFADAVVCAQAFHWFRPGPALREIHRVLRPGGGLGLVWNTRDDRVRWSRRLTELMAPYRRGSPHERDRAPTAAFARPGARFSPLTARTVRHVQWGTPALFVERVLSVSSIALLARPRQRALARAVRRLLATDPATAGRSRIALPYRTEIYWAYRR